MGHGQKIYDIPIADNLNFGTVRCESNITNVDGYLPTPIIYGVPYYKDDSEAIEDLQDRVSKLEALVESLSNSNS